MAKNNIKPANRVRFAWWGAEESGLVGATRYVEAISNEEFAKIAANLNFDMLASPNHANFVYDGDFSDTHAAGHRAGPQPGRGRDRGGRSSRLLQRRRTSPIEPTAFDGRSDYKPFQDNGVAAGGLFSGAEVAKTAAQAAKWGGTAGVAVRPVLPPGLRQHRQPRHGGGRDPRRRRRARAGALAEDPNVRQTLAAGGVVDRGRRRASRRGARGSSVPGGTSSPARAARHPTQCSEGRPHGRPSCVCGSRLAGMAAPHLTDLERLAMERVWALGEATVRAVLEGLNEDRSRAPRAYTTVLTIMQRLEAKGMLARRPGDGPVVFRPAVARDVYLGARVDAEVSRLVEDFGELALVQFARQVQALDPERREALRRLGEAD